MYICLMERLTRRESLILFILGALFTPFKLNAKGLTSFDHSKLHISSKLGKFEFNVELAVTERQQSLGLMYRRNMPSIAGMLFDYKVPKTITMWMKNTFIPLDMIFIAPDGRVIRIVERTIPFSETIITSNKKARAVLEVNSGTASKLGLKIGDRIKHKIFGNAE